MKQYTELITGWHETQLCVGFINNIAEDYLKALINAGVDNPSPLPVANKTANKKKDLADYYTEDIKSQAIHVFGPFLNMYNYSFPQDWGKGITRNGIGRNQGIDLKYQNY